MDTTNSEIDITPISFQEARECIDTARDCIDGIQEKLETLKRVLLRLHRGQGWKALGYASWRECAIEEFGRSRAYVFRLLSAAQVEENLVASKSTIVDLMDESTIVDLENLPITQLSELAKLPTDQQAEGLLKAEEIAQAQGKKRNAQHVAQAVKSLKRQTEPAPADDLSVKAPGFEQVKSAADIDAVIDSKGVRAFAHEFVSAEPDVRVRIRRYYPGADVIVRAELGDEVLARIQDIDAAFDQPAAAPNTVEQELTQQAENLGLPTSSKQVLPDVERNHISPADVDDRPFVYASPLNTTVNVIIAPPSNVSNLGDDQLKQVIKDAQRIIRDAKQELNKRHHPHYFSQARC